MAIETALDLITRSYYLSQIVSRQLQEVEGYQIKDGLYLLNALLDIKGSDLRLIPYYSETVFNSVQGQETYFLPNVLSAETCNFNIEDVRFPMTKLTRDQYRGLGRIDNVQSLPFSYNVERALGGLNISVYYVPQAQYVMKTWGQVGLTDVSLQTSLASVYDPFYIEYLRFALAEYICIDYAQNFPEKAAMKLAEIRKKLMDTSPPDLSISKVTTLGKHDVFNWGLVNIPGWVPS